MPLLDADTQARLDAARAGPGTGRMLHVGDLEVGDWGVLDVVVDQIHPPRPFQRKRGGEGTVGRVALRDDSGAIDIVLWDDENRLAVDGPLAYGTRLVIRGATVKAGWRGGLELALGSAVLEPHAPKGATRLEGVLVECSPVQTVGDPPRQKLEAVILTGGIEVTVTCWDDAIAGVQVAPGDAVSILARPHPALDGYYIA